MILPVYIEPQPLLRQPTQPVGAIDDALRSLAANMRETMHGANGIGLAAPQVGESVSMFVAEYTDKEKVEIPFTVFVNPQIVWRSGQKNVIEEGCLSIPGIYGDVRRPKKITVKYLDLEGRDKEMTVDGIFARIIQHETDHLKGILFTDYVPEEKRTFRKPPAYPKL
jgi:peptide deformylase